MRENWWNTTVLLSQCHCIGTRKSGQSGAKKMPFLMEYRSAGRGSGWSCDVRKYKPHSLYNQVFEFGEIRTTGDCMHATSTAWMKLEESLHIIEQLIDNIPEGDVCAKVKPIIRLPEGQYFQSGSRQRWIRSIYWKPEIKSVSWSSVHSMAAVSVMPILTKGEKIADLINISGSLTS